MACIPTEQFAAFRSEVLGEPFFRGFGGGRSQEGGGEIQPHPNQPNLGKRGVVTPAAGRYLSIGSIIIDDIVLPDGRSQMGMLGGGGTHAVMGMRAWSNQIRFITGVGNDFPPELEPTFGRV